MAERCLASSEPGTLFAPRCGKPATRQTPLGPRCEACFNDLARALDDPRSLIFVLRMHSLARHVLERGGLYIEGYDDANEMRAQAIHLRRAGYFDAAHVVELQVVQMEQGYTRTRLPGYRVDGVRPVWG